MYLQKKSTRRSAFTHPALQNAFRVTDVILQAGCDAAFSLSFF